MPFASSHNSQDLSYSLLTNPTSSLKSVSAQTLSNHSPLFSSYSSFPSNVSSYSNASSLREPQAGSLQQQRPHELHDLKRLRLADLLARTSGPVVSVGGFAAPASSSSAATTAAALVAGRIAEPVSAIQPATNPIATAAMLLTPATDLNDFFPPRIIPDSGDAASILKFPSLDPSILYASPADALEPDFGTGGAVDLTPLLSFETDFASQQPSLDDPSHLFGALNSPFASTVATPAASVLDLTPAVTPFAASLDHFGAVADTPLFDFAAPACASPLASASSSLFWAPSACATPLADSLRHNVLSTPLLDSTPLFSSIDDIVETPFVAPSDVFPSQNTLPLSIPGPCYTSHDLSALNAALSASQSTPDTGLLPFLSDTPLMTGLETPMVTPLVSALPAFAGSSSVPYNIDASSLIGNPSLGALLDNMVKARLQTVLNNLVIEALQDKTAELTSAAEAALSSSSEPGSADDFVVAMSPLESTRLAAPSAMKEKLQERRYACDYEGCGRAFSRQFNLKAHKKTHEDCRDRPFECPICNQRFFRNHDLTRHSTVHTKVKEWKCESCDKEFTRKDALARHVLRQCGTAAADLE